MPTNRDFNLLDQANHYLKMANFAYNKIDLNTMEEDFYIRDCCLFLQMTLELYVKGLVEHLCGVDYNHTHYFANNINIIKSNRENINNFDKLENILDRLDDREEVIVKWHTNAVYVSGFQTTKRQIDEVLNIAEDLKEYVNNNILEEVNIIQDNVNGEQNNNNTNNGIEETEKDGRI